MDLSTQILGILNSTEGLDLNADKKDKLSKENSLLVDQLMNISKSEKSDSGKNLKSIASLESKLGQTSLAF